MPGIKEPTPPLRPYPQVSVSRSPPPTESPSRLETTSNILPSNGPSELFGELQIHSSSENVTPPPTITPTLPKPSRCRQVQVRNRRLHYLTTHHNEYFANTELELADPLLYDKCIRSFQTPAEREAEGKRKGWSGILHADLERAEARMEAIRKATAAREEARNAGVPDEDEDEDKVENKEEGIERWEDAMTRRFLAGGDDDVDYNTIDDNEDYDDAKEIEREVHEAYFDAETPSAPAEGSSCTDTGIQDF